MCGRYIPETRTHHVGCRSTSAPARRAPVLTRAHAWLLPRCVSQAQEKAAKGYIQKNDVECDIKRYEAGWNFSKRGK